VKSDRLTEYTVQLRSRNIFLQFADRYLERNGAELKSKYGKDAARFAAEFAVTPKMLDEITAMGKAKNVEVQKDQYEKDLPYIKAFARAYIARGLWGNEGSARIMLREDSQFHKAMELFPETEQILSSLSSLK
jgi:carboxyl-terminal processing protease